MLSLKYVPQWSQSVPRLAVLSCPMLHHKHIFKLCWDFGRSHSGSIPQSYRICLRNSLAFSVLYCWCSRRSMFMHYQDNHRCGEISIWRSGENARFVLVEWVKNLLWSISPHVHALSWPINIGSNICWALDRSGFWRTHIVLVMTSSVNTMSTFSRWGLRCCCCWTTVHSGALSRLCHQSLERRNILEVTLATESSVMKIWDVLEWPRLPDVLSWNQMSKEINANQWICVLFVEVHHGIKTSSMIPYSVLRFSSSPMVLRLDNAGFWCTFKTNACIGTPNTP